MILILRIDSNVRLDYGTTVADRGRSHVITICLCSAGKLSGRGLCDSKSNITNRRRRLLWHNDARTLRCEIRLMTGRIVNPGLQRGRID